MKRRIVQDQCAAAFGCFRMLCKAEVNAFAKCCIGEHSYQPDLQANLIQGCRQRVKKIIAHLRYLSVMRRRSELAHEVSNRRQFIFVAFLFYTGFDRNLLNQNINNN